MMIKAVKSKIHRVSITQAELNYIGSITIDEALLEALHKVRAYYSVPGAYLEGKHDGE
jgi:aspartate 1-decarboxylase